MASLTPLSKGLIALAVVGAMASAAWHLALKERFGSAAPSSTQATAAAPPPSPTAPPATPAPEPAATGARAEPSSSNLAENAEQGRRYLDSGDYDRARPYLERAVQGGDGAAACHLGDMTLKGQGGIPASQEKAAALYQIAQSRNIICFASGK